jgi:predicted RND superfamily exporter protein
MAMFTVVGLLGMTGIIINDSIVLVSTIDEYAQDRGLIPSIIDGTADRLRPVLLTTLTTVLGMAPLLYESSQQAQFLKPTVITLVYGLGFGMVLVLLVVPALMAIQQDISRPLTALRRSVFSPNRAVKGAVAGTAAAMALWLAATMGWVLVAGALPGPLARALPRLGAADPMLGALLVFVAGALVILGLANLVAGLAYGRAARRAQP